MVYWNLRRSEYLGDLIIKEWEKAPIVELKQDKKNILLQIHQILSEDLKKEKDLEEAVQFMLDELEKTRSGQFERYKMYPLLKKEMAKKKGVIL